MTFQWAMYNLIKFVVEIETNLNAIKYFLQVVACIRPHNLEVPDMSGNCTFNGVSTASQIVINSTLTNSSISIPYPETGVWYASFRLFCDKCSPCSCSEDCKQQYNHCLVNCLKKCVMVRKLLL